MKIAVLGAGAMGALFGGYLSKHNDVWLVDVDAQRVKAITKNGVTVTEKQRKSVYLPKAVTNTAGLGEMDLIIVFVKAMFTLEALQQNQHLIGKDTYIMTLQNGAGHETKLLQFIDSDHVLIGTTQHNSSIISDGHIHHGGGGKTTIGVLGGNSTKVQHIADNFSNCGFETIVSDNVKKHIWTKIFLNTAASSLTAILQVPLGFILDDLYASLLMEKLVHEAVTVANAEGFAQFDVEEVIGNIKMVLTNAKGGYTSIYADLKNGVRTEVDTISGSVVETAKRLGIAVPYHEFVVHLIHAMENKSLNK
ncbi:MAG: 2-dehydropantoate 2-reductase [Anaerolineales bacterium]|nr:2-dehydropantoate 2-reductase [Anaerolineales bacterium]